MYKIGIECESIEDQQWGVGRIITRLLQEIASRPELIHEFRFVLYFKSKIPDYPYLNNPIFEKKIVSVPLLSRLFSGFAPASFSLYYYVLLPIKLYTEGLDVMYFPNYMLPIIFIGTSLVFLTEDVYYEAHYGSNPFRYRLAYMIFAWWAAKFATLIMAMSQSSLKEVSRVYDISEHKIRLNQLGIDINEGTQTHASTLASGDYLLYVGQAFPRRHLREALLAFEKIAPEFPELRMIAVGYDKYNPPIVRQLVRHINHKLGAERILHRDYVDQGELEALYRKAKAVIYVSDKEAFGLPPLEALGYGSIPIVADVPVSRELFGDHAFFVKNSASVDETAQAMREALTNESKRAQIQASAPAILKRYSWAEHTDRFLTILKDLCQNS